MGLWEKGETPPPHSFFAPILSPEESHTFLFLRAWRKGDYVFVHLSAPPVLLERNPIFRAGGTSLHSQVERPFLDIKCFCCLTQILLLLAIDLFFLFLVVCIFHSSGLHATPLSFCKIIYPDQGDAFALLCSDTYAGNNLTVLLEKRERRRWMLGASVDLMGSLEIMVATFCLIAAACLK